MKYHKLSFQECLLKLGNSALATKDTFIHEQIILFEMRNEEAPLSLYVDQCQLQIYIF